MALNFPASPAYNDEFVTQNGAKYKYDGNKWVFTPFDISANAHIGLEPPPLPKDGDLWWNSETGILYIYYVEPPEDWYNMQDSSFVLDGQWVQAVIPDISYGLPIQEGYDGKCLLTNGTHVYWGDISVIPISKPTVSLDGVFYEGSVMSNKEITFTSSEFSDPTTLSSHLYTDWRILTETRRVVYTSIDDTVNLTELTIPANTLYGNQTYILQIRHVSTLNVFSDFHELLFSTVHPMSIVNTDGILEDQTTWKFDEESDTGFYGIIESYSFITGSSLSTETGLEVGTLLYDFCDWLKFYVGANAVCNTNNGVPYVMYVSKRPVRYGIGWENINTVGAVDGTKVIAINDNNYKVRLLSGAKVDPTIYGNGVACEDKAGETSEWNELIYRVHKDVPTCIDPAIGMPQGHSTSRHGGSQMHGNWLRLDDDELATNHGLMNGTLCHCKEKNTSGDNVERGYYGIAGWHVSTSSHSSRSWRPVLELV